MFNEKKKVLGKGKKLKDIAGIRKIELPRTKQSEDYSKKFRSLKILNQDFGRKSNTPTPQTNSKNHFFQRVSESPHITTHSSFSKRKSLPNISEISEIYVKSLHMKLQKYKEKIFSLEEELKELETKFLGQESELYYQIETLTFELKSSKDKSNDEQILLNQQILNLRKENEDSVQRQNNILAGLYPLLAEHLDLEGCEKLLGYVASFEQKDSENIFTGGFNSLANSLRTSRDTLQPSSAQAIVLTEYEPQSQGELNLKLGDVVTILNSDDHNIWWLGKIGNKIGVFPRQHVMLD